MKGAKYIFHRKVHSTTKRIYHLYDATLDGPACRQTIKDPVTVSNVPSNRQPCKHCFSLRRQRGR